MLVATAIGALAWALVDRVLGPSDTWDQTQPRTVSYTVDMLRNGGLHWVLPVERGEAPATKPPLYNWLAAPAVAWLGFSSDPAHRAPSIVAACLLWLAVVRLGRRLDPETSGRLGWLAGAMLASCYFFFKLAYLARPDMLLTLFLFVGWMAGTALLVEPHTRGARLGLAAVFWGCTALGALTKGPPALVLAVYAPLAARSITGTWGAAKRFGFFWGVPLAVAPFALWLVGVWLIDREHLIGILWFREFFGRITGLGAEVDGGGPIAFLSGIPNMPFYFFSRAFPWSILSVLALVSLWRYEPQGPDGGARCRRWRRVDGQTGAWLHGAGLFIVITVTLFSLSAGRRADYVAATAAPAVLLAAWWWLHGSPRLGERLPWLAPAGVAIVLAVLSIRNHMQVTPGIAMDRFIRDAEALIAEDPQPVMVWAAGTTYLAAYFGHADTGDPEAIRRMISSGRPFWVVAGLKPRSPKNFPEWLEAESMTARLREFARSERLSWHTGWPKQVFLYHVEAAER